jgi:hypothetical protein
MGLRRRDEALILATLPAGTQREAGIAHVWFNATAQAVASRVLRQEDRQLVALGVVHTHPGSLRHPSNGDYEGDREWVRINHKQLRGGEGVFGIGTADGAREGTNPLVAFQTKRNNQCYLGLRFTWYALGVGERNYRPLPVQLTIGPDLARPLHSVWPTLEAHAERLDRLCRRLARVRLEVIPDGDHPELHVVIPLEGDDSIRVVLCGDSVTYCLIRKEQWLVSDHPDPNLERGVYQLLAQLANDADG